MDEALERFVRESLSRGRSKDEIRRVLLEAGWARDGVNEALESFADVTFDVPVPRPKPYLSAREAFVYLVMFTTLYASALSLGSILFAIIESLFPDPAKPGYGQSIADGIRWSAAWLVIAFPVWAWLARRVHLALRREPEKRSSRVRKWLTYLTLFVAAVVIIGDLVVLVFSLLAGELTVRFVLKVAVAAGIAGAVFGYYTRELRDDELEPGRVRGRRPGVRAAFVSTCLVVVATLGGGLWIAGSPGAARDRQLDDRRERDLQAIAGAIDEYWRRHESLPWNLEALESERDVPVRSIRDPQSGARYEYRILGSSTYELCASFAAASEEKPEVRAGSRFWEHDAGRTCFEIDVRADD
jgi:hypothetical protein